MKKARSFIGLNVVAQAGGESLGTVRDLLFDSNSSELLALVLSDKELFGLVQAQVVPWREVVSVGQDAIIVQSAASKIKAASDERLSAVVQRETTLGGTRIMTTDGQELGTLGDVFVDENTGRVTGYEISGGFISDTLHGKRFLPAVDNVQMGKDVAFVPPEVAAQIEQRAWQPGSWQHSTMAAGERFSHLAGNVRSKAEALYADMATTSADKQEAWVTGRIAAHDLRLPNANVISYEAALHEAALHEAALHEAAPYEAQSPTDNEFLVRAGALITPEIARRARELGLLGNLTVNAIENTVTTTYASGKERLLGTPETSSSAPPSKTTQPTQTTQGPLETMHAKAASAAIGKTAGRTVLRPDGSTLIAPGEVITEIVLSEARQFGRENEVIASAGVGAAQAGVESAKVQASQLWSALKGKAEEFSGSAQNKRSDAENAALQKRIAEAAGKRATRLILDRNDEVIVTKGDIITYAAIERACTAGSLEVLLNSVEEDADNDVLPPLPIVVEKVVVTNETR